MSKIVELSIGEIENVVGGITVTASASRYPAPPETNKTRNPLPTDGTSMNRGSSPRPPRPSPIN